VEIVEVNRNLPCWNCQQCSTVCNSHQKTAASHLPWDYHLYRDFPVKIDRWERIESSPMFERHWHEQIQILYFEQGEATILCNTNTYMLKPGDILIINTNEIHYGISYNGQLIYHIIKPEFNFLSSSQQDLCQTKYIMPLLQDRIRFQNQISQDSALSAEIRRIITEYTEQNLGFELAIKASIYHILVYLLRHYQQESPAPSEQERQQKTLRQLRTALEYIDEHYSETIRLNELANLANLSSQHFCRLFKKLTGKRPMDYINYLRINKAVTLLSESNYNISEIAAAVGFDDSNYFSRIFKKYKKSAPSAYRK
jgi:AraC-like DNA-binding protein/mannose-6-phosphate isomerase-like protein (cupin superfamily)